MFLLLFDLCKSEQFAVIEFLSVLSFAVIRTMFYFTHSQYCSQWLFPSVVFFISFALNRTSLLLVVLFSPFALSRTSCSCFLKVRTFLPSVVFGLTRTFALCRTYFLSVVLSSFSFKQISAFRALFPFFLPGDEI